MKIIFLIAIVIIWLHDVQSYILLTANMEDVQSLAKQLAASPVVDQVKKIWRRASIQFQKQLYNARRGGDETDDEDDKDMETNRRTRRLVRDMIALGKESGYLEPIQKLVKSF